MKHALPVSTAASPNFLSWKGVQSCAFQANFCFLKLNLLKYFHLENGHFHYLTPGRPGLPWAYLQLLKYSSKETGAFRRGSSRAPSEPTTTTSVSAPIFHAAAGLSLPAPSAGPERWLRRATSVLSPGPDRLPTWEPTALEE